MWRQPQSSDLRPYPGTCPRPALNCGTQEGPFPATGREFALALCELWRFDPSGRVVGGDLYYDQVSLLTQLGLMP
jgi:hypothetical protein